MSQASLLRVTMDSATVTQPDPQETFPEPDLTHMLTAVKSTWRHKRESDQRLIITPPTPRFRKKKTIPTSDWITVISYAQTKSISLPLSHLSFLERPLSLSFFESPWQTWVRRLGKVAQGQTCCLLLWRTTACGELRILPPAEANLLLKDTRKREGARAQLVVIFES